MTTLNQTPHDDLDAGAGWMDAVIAVFCLGVALGYLLALVAA